MATPITVDGGSEAIQGLAVGVSGWSIRTKLLGTVGLLVASIVAVGGMSLYGLAKTDEDINILYEQRTRPIA